jgi:4-alpha-glucanotransferase
MGNPAPPQKREAGILLHPTSLPGDGPSGELGDEALRFIDFLAAAGQSLWQVLPLGPVHEDRSPYQSLSAFAGSPELIGRAWLLQQWWPEGEWERLAALPREELLEQTYEHFSGRRDDERHRAFGGFCREHAHWLEDYALFRVLKRRFSQRSWVEWPARYRDRLPAAMEELRLSESRMLGCYRFEQFLFFSQWQRIKAYANDRGVRILGDMPIFVSHDSADVWACRDAFELDAAGHATVVAGVPPDYFSETGQRWGNPLYDWDWMEADGFQWWHRRIAHKWHLYDLLRIDHFRGFEACWEIPAHEETAVNGRWVQVPGDEMFASLAARFGTLPIIAEDLGIITDEVRALRKKYGFPGMLILQFAFDSGQDNPYLPHNHTEDSIVYTGTHDNDTTLGWYRSLTSEQRQRVLAYLGMPGEPMPWPLIEAAYASIARQAIIPLQDALALDGEHRLNVPGTTEGNWRWRFQWEMLPDGLAERLAGMAARYGRDTAHGI